MNTERRTPRLVGIKMPQDNGKKKISEESSEKQLLVHKGLQYDQEINYREKRGLCRQGDDIIEGKTLSTKSLYLAKLTFTTEEEIDISK